MADEETKLGISRRTFIKRTAIGVAGGAVAGFGVGVLTGRHLEAETQKSLEITDEPYDVQIRRWEAQLKPENLRDKNLRDEFAFLLSLWYADWKNRNTGKRDKTFGLFPYSKLLGAIEYIEDPNDERLKSHEENRALTYPGERILINLTALGFTQQFFEDEFGANFTPLQALRNTLTHEFGHFIAVGRADQKSLFQIQNLNYDTKGFQPSFLQGFSTIFDQPDPNNPDVAYQILSNLDEATTELIGNYWQRTSRLGGIPAYGGNKKVEGIIPLLEATLIAAGISIKDFALLHAHSDLDELAKKFADATDSKFKNEEEKIKYGLELILAIEEQDIRNIGKYWKEITPSQVQK